ncbi:MAG: hypothetical protein H6609_20275 [Ignavibacteriales bacterium]|nr:hypothetical protein [Ignavibacteriales bacterium]
MKLKKQLYLLLSAITFFLITSCCTTKNELKEESNGENNVMLKRESAPIPLAPGTAEIVCKVKDMYEKENKSFAKIKVNEIKEYGPSTKPIAVGSEFEFAIKDSYKNRFEKSKSSNSEIEITIAYNRGGVGQELNGVWNIIKINK